MSTIGSGPGISPGTQIEPVSARATSTSDTRLPTPAPATPAQNTAASATASSAAGQAAVVSSPTLSAGSTAPVDRERVSQIKKAVQTGTYPLLPTKISDAMIAAGFMLQGNP